MLVLTGKQGLTASWQKPFTPNIKCKKCGANARIVFTAFEGRETRDFICNIHKNTGNGKTGKY